MHALLCRRRFAQFRNEIHVVIQLYAPRAIQLHLLERLSDYIVGLMFGLLGRFDHSSLVEVVFVVNVELAKGVLESENLSLLELGVFFFGV